MPPKVTLTDDILPGVSAATSRLERLSAAASRKGVHPRTIRRRIADGSITGYRFGPRLIMVDCAEVDAALLHEIPTVA